MIRNQFLVLFFITINYLNLSGQDELKNPTNLAIKPQYGVILPHSSKVEHLTHTNPFGLELEYSWLMRNDNPEIIGNSYNLIGFAEPFFIRSNRFLFSARMGIGASFLDKIYDSEDNPENTFFSTYLNFIVHIDINAYYKLNDQYSLMAYAKYNHISNGAVKQPNYGMNFPTFGLGLNYYPSGKVLFPEREKQEFIPKYFYNVYIFGMVRKISENEYFPESTTYVFGFYGLAGRTVSLLNGFSIGVEYLNDGANKEKIIRESLSLDHQQVSGLISHHLLFGKFDFSQSWGTYIYAPYKFRNFYQRYSINYQFSKSLIVGLTLKVHGDVADNFNILIGISF